MELSKTCKGFEICIRLIGSPSSNGQYIQNICVALIHTFWSVVLIPGALFQRSDYGLGHFPGWTLNFNAA